jgi:glycosyltransferase involved in cell wall biosynthesis
MNGMRAKKVLFLTLNPFMASTKARLLDSLDYIKDDGISCTVVPMPPGLLGRLAVMATVRKYDAVFIQRKLLREFEIKMMRALNPRIAFDVDDAIMFHEVERSEPLEGTFFKRFIGMVENSKTVLVGNRFLYGFARHNNRNVHIVPTPVNVSAYVPKDYDAASDELIIGWLGTKGNLKYVESVGQALKEVCRRYPKARLKIVSMGSIDIEGVRIIKKTWKEEEHVQDLRSMDIGIMPLYDDIWTMGKSGNKILQYFGVAVPVVASPVGVNSEIIDHGVDGFLAGTQEQWVEYLSVLIEDKKLRRAMGFKGREKVEKLYSQERHREKLLEIIRDL